MENNPKKLYQPPRVTRVILRKEQALLVGCSNGAFDQNLSNAVHNWCINDATWGCQKDLIQWAETDSAAPAS